MTIKSILAGLLFPLITCQGNPGKTSDINTDSLRSGTTLNLKIKELDPRLKENSGLIMYRGVFWTINDSGNDPVLYAFHPVSGRILQQIHIINARNRDWEELAQDNDHIFIGDFGNNYGQRIHLQVYKIKKADLPDSKDAGVSAEMISFSYGDRSEDEPSFSRSPYDCEAFFAWNDSLYLFTKNWQNETTTMYVMSSEPGGYIINPRTVFNTGGLVTAAEISKNGKIVTLLGYKDYIPFVWVLRDFNFPDIFDGHQSRLEFPSYYDLQTEGITIQKSDIIYISCERSTFPPSVYWINLKDLTIHDSRNFLPLGIEFARIILRRVE